MEAKLVKEIIDNLTFEKQDIGSFVIINSNKRLNLDKEYFSALSEQKSNATIAFVDGGNGELLRSSNFSLHLIKLAAGLWGGKEIKRLQKEFFALVQVNGEKYVVKTFGANLNIKLEFDLFENEHRKDPSTIAGNVRKIAELEYAAEVCETYLPTFIVRDGDLQVTEDFETEPFNKLLKTNQNVFGLSKTSSLLTDTGVPASVALSKISPHSCWLYDAKSDVCFVKLHEKSKYVFRLDVNDKKQINELMNLLQFHSRDPSFLGYPYGLIEVDLRARVTEQEVQQIKMNILARHEKQLEPFLKSEDAHDVLNLLW